MDADDATVLACLCNESGEHLGSPFDIPLSITPEQLGMLCNSLLQNADPKPYAFFVNEKEIVNNLESVVEGNVSTEKTISIVYQPQAIFRVIAVTRCTSSIEGHTEAVLATSFSPNGRHLASASGDTRVRFWDLNTETPQFTCEAHRHWVLCIAWAPNGQKLASACKNGQICIWNPSTGKQLGKKLSGHRQWVTCLTWEPFHLHAECRNLASASKDGSVKIWDTKLGTCTTTLNGHMQSVTCVKWSGEGLLYTASQDRTIKVWRSNDGVLCRTLEGHGHWVNTMALNTDYVMRTGAFEPAEAGSNIELQAKALQTKALERYKSVVSHNPERMVSGSDDFTLYMWNPSKEKKSLVRMTGHQAVVNDVKFSPDGRIVASASFDKSIKLWSGKDGKHIGALRGHVGPVYQIAWSADSRLLVSGSGDSTLKLWSVPKHSLLVDLPGHADEVYAVDWSPDGQRVVSGGKDRVLKIWRK